jgi:2-polyprenyl-3-methyl-5-hydroxy-6-metoxy-1,4-benzoquinol methylase
MAVNEAKLHAFVTKVVQDLGAAMSAPLVLIGDKLGLYKAMAGQGPMTPTDLAHQTNTSERYVREWLCANAASGYVGYDPSSGTFTLSDEQAMAFADESSPVYMPGAYQIILSAFMDEPKITEAFKSGEGVGWHEHHPCLFSGTERFFRSGYNAHLVTEWIPSLDGMDEKLKRGAKVADVGCGHGASTIIMAQAYPNSTFVGYDYHEASIHRARQQAEEAGLSDRVQFEVAASKEFPGKDFDLIAFFDCLHDMGDPVGASAHVHSALHPEGTWMIVEPFAGDRVEDNLNPVGRVYYAASTMICTPASLDQEVGLALGAQAGEARLREVVMQGGFSRFHRATETPFNMVFEARP